MSYLAFYLLRPRTDIYMTLKTNKFPHSCRWTTSQRLKISAKPPLSTLSGLQGRHEWICGRLLMNDSAAWGMGPGWSLSTVSVRPRYYEVALWTFQNWSLTPKRSGASDPAGMRQPPPARNVPTLLPLLRAQHRRLLFKFIGLILVQLSFHSFTSSKVLELPELLLDLLILDSGMAGQEDD